MKKLILSIATLAMIGCNNHKYDLKPTELYWRNANWDTKVNITKADTNAPEGIGIVYHSVDKSFVLSKKIGNVSVYKRNAEKLCIGKECLDSVNYYFYKDSLMLVRVFFPKEEYSTISDYMNEEFGKPFGYGSKAEPIWLDQVLKEHDRYPDNKTASTTYYRYYMKLGMVSDDDTAVCIEYANACLYHMWLDEPKVDTMKVVKQENFLRKELNLCPLH